MLLAENSTFAWERWDLGGRSAFCVAPEQGSVLMATFTNSTSTNITDAAPGTVPATTTSTIVVSGMDPFLINLDLHNVHHSHVCG